VSRLAAVRAELAARRLEITGYQIPPVARWRDHAPRLRRSGRATTAIALIAADRPAYFEQALASLCATRQARELPVFVFLDRVQDALADRQEQLARAAGLPFLTIVRRPINFGCGRNMIDARRQLMDVLGFERMFHFEDDLVYAPDYLTLCTHLLDWAEARYSNVGMVQAWAPCIADRERKQREVAVVEGTFHNQWGYLMSRRCWRSIRSILYRYEHAFLRGEYRERPHQLIRQWAQALLSRGADAARGNRPFPTDVGFVQARDAYFAKLPSGQDGITSVALRLLGWVRLATRVNRARYIGEQGVHMNPGRFRDEFGYDKVVLDELDGDRDRTVFEASTG
jgi:hypothetical protein